MKKMIIAALIMILAVLTPAQNKSKFDIQTGMLSKQQSSASVMNSRFREWKNALVHLTLIPGGVFHHRYNRRTFCRHHR